MLRNIAVLILFVFPGLSWVETCCAQGEIENVLLVISDDLRANALGCYGGDANASPNLDRLASQGMVFERAYCQGVVCGPSRRSFMYSRYKGKRGVSLGAQLRRNGWQSARVGKIFHMRVPGDIIAGTNGEDEASCWDRRYNATGLEAHTPGDYACLNLNIFSDRLENRESTQTKHRMFVTVEYDGDGSDQPDHKACDKAIEWLREERTNPFFLAVGFVRPHYPMVAPRQFYRPFPWENMSLPPVFENDEADIPELGLAGTRNSRNPIGNYPDNQKRMWTGYYASVAFMDAQVGRLLEELERQGVRDKTAIVFISDHGYHLGDHGFWQKANLHEQAIRVPMIVSVPGKPAGRCDSIVELVDVYPTIAELAGISFPREVQGQSLVPLLSQPEQTLRDSALSFHDGVSLRTKDWHFIQYKDGSEELYDMRGDEDQFHNLAVDLSKQSMLADWRKRLATVLERREVEIAKSR
ncbi:MAG: sulfatase [Pirellulaceae bacterium]